MSRQEQRGGFAIRRQDVADFHAEHFENGIARGNHLHFRQLRVDVAELCTRLCDAHLRRGDIFLLCFGGAVCPL
jgi:hypothetical protein